METKTLEDILFQVYELGVQQTDCDITENANTIMMLANQRVIEELESVLNRTDKGSILEEHLIERIQQLKQD